MSSGNVIKGTTLQNDIKKPHIARPVRVAIPLPLSKPRASTQKNDTTVRSITKDQPALLGKEQSSHETTLKEELKNVEVKSIDDANIAPGLANGSDNDTLSTIPLSEQSKETIQRSNEINTAAVTPSVDSVSKKPTQIRTELPPAFVPSSGIPTPQTADSSARSSRNSHASFPPTTFSRPHSAQINLGVNGSGTPSPGPYAFNIPSRNPPFQPYHSHNTSDAPPYSSHRQNGSYSSQYGRHHHQDSQTLTNHATFNELNGHHDFNSASPQFHAPFFPIPRPGFEDALSLRQHVSSLYASEVFADVELRIHVERKQSTTSINAHKLILARSPTLLKLLSQGKFVVDITQTGKWADEQAIQAAISFLYGGNLLAENAGNVLASVPGDTDEARLRYTLAYIAAGQYLDIPPVVQRGIEVSTALFTWEVLPVAIEFATGDAHSLSNGTQNGSTPVMPRATPLLHAIAHFLAFALPQDFHLDSAAPGLPLRLPDAARPGSGDESPLTNGRPVAHRASRSINDPRLTKLRFGDVGASATPHTMISSILISAPYTLLVLLLDFPLLVQRLNWDGVAHLMHTLITVRESRRSKALERSRLDGSQYPELAYQESIENDSASPSGIRILRRKAT